jgi:Ferredoxin-dependent bilin reductase
MNCQKGVDVYVENMTPLWNRLNEYASYIESKFDQHFDRFDNPKYTDDMHFPGWTDTFWQSVSVSKAHLKTIVPENDKGLWLMHVNVFPRPSIELPILGFDIVAGPKKITGSFMDYSPLHGFPHPYHQYMEMRVKGLEWNKPRELPQWAQEIFSPDMIAVGNINTEEELDQFIQVTKDLLNHYLDNIISNSFVLYKGSRDTKPLLNKYCTNQKMNPHLHRSILAMGISEEDKDRYVNNVLFEEI